MAFTKVVGPGIHTLAQLRTHNIHSAGIITATRFVGEIGAGTGNTSTFTNVNVTGNLTVQGDTTTLNTTLRNVELLRVAANTNTTAGIITQTGTGDILNLFDATTEVMTVVDGGKVGIGVTNPSTSLQVANGHINLSSGYSIQWSDSHERIEQSDSTLEFFTGNGQKMALSGDNLGIGITNPTGKLHISHSAGRGIFVDDNSNSSTSPYIQVLGRRSDGNTQQSFTGQIFLSSLRTDQKVASGKQLGTVLFGGNHTDGTEANILYAASIAGVADDNFDSATDMPTALVFKTGTTGRAPLATNVSSGDERLRITSAGLVEINNFNGIGLRLKGSGGDYQGVQLQTTDSSASQTRNIFIDVVNETGAAIANQIGQVQSDGGSHWSWQTQPAGNRADRRAERLRITSTGDVLMGGLTSKSGQSTAILSINGGSSNIGILNVHSDDGENDGDLSGITFSHGGGANATTTARAKAAIALRAIGSYGRGDLCFYVDGTGDNNGVAAADERLRITRAGKVGIGTDNPKAELDVHRVGTGVTASVVVRGETAVLAIMGDATNTSASETDARLVFGSDGDVGDGKYLNSPLTSHGFEIALLNEEPGSGLRFHDGTANAERLRIKADGKIGINEPNPDSNLEINRGSEGKYLTIGGDDADNGRGLSFTSSTGGTGSNGALHTINAKSGNGAIALATTGLERLRIDNAGRVKIGTISDHTSGTTHCPVYIRMTTDLTATNTAEGSANNGLVRIEETGTNANRYHGIELRNRQSGDIRFLNKDVSTSDRGDLFLVMPSSASTPNGMHTKLRFNSIKDSIQIAGKGGAVIANTGTEHTDVYISTVTGVTAVNTQAGDEVAGLIRFEDKGSSNNRFHGLELRNRNSGDARILNKSVGADNTSQMWFAVDGKNDSTTSNDIREAMVISQEMVVSGKMILNREITANQGHNCWTTSGAWKNLVDLANYPNNCLYICDAAMQYSSAYTATFWVYKTRQSQYKVVHDQDSLCHFRVEQTSIIQIQQNSGVDQTDTFGYQKVFMAPMGMDYNETSLS